MTVHPRYINRRHAKREYVFVHRSPEFRGHICGVRFVAGQCQPVPMRHALRICGAAGSKIRYGYCVSVPHVFGDCSPQERACALEAGGMVLGPEERFRVLLGRAEALGHDVPGGQVAEGLAELLALEPAERDVALDGAEADMDAAELEATEADQQPDEKPDEDSAPSEDEDRAFDDGKTRAFDDGTTPEVEPEVEPDNAPDDGPREIALGATPPGGDTPQMREWLEDKAREQGFTDLRWDEDSGHPRLFGTPAADPPKFSTETPPVLSEPHRVKRAFFEDKAMTKARIDAWAQEHIGLSLDTRQTKDALIDQVMAHPNVEEQIGD